MHSMIISQSTLVQPSAAVDPGFVQLLLNFNQTNGATSIIDESRFARTLTGDAYCCVSTAQAKFGTGSLKLTNVTQDGLYIAPHADFGYTTGTKWTFEYWLYVDTWPSSASSIDLRFFNSGASISAHFGFAGASGASLHLIENVGGGQHSGSSTFATGSWVHVAAEDDGTNTIIYLNGAAEYTDGQRSAAGTNAIGVGGYYGYGAASGTDGTVVYLDGVRLTIGKNVYGGAFTPPSTAPTVMV